MAHEHKSGLPHSYDRAAAHPEWQAVAFHGRRPLIQGAELNEMQTIARGRHDRLGRLIAKDGDRTEGAFAIVDQAEETVTLTAGKIYVAGDVLPVAAAVLEDVVMTGRTSIGVRLVTTWLTADDDPSLRGLVAGSLAENEDGAAREVATVTWAKEDDGGDGEYHPVYLLQEGTILDQTAPQALDGMRQALAIYDRPNGNYIVSGCAVSALGLNAGKQVFSVSAGEANIYGFKVTRFAALRYEEPEDWDTGAVPGETHTYPGGASHTFTVHQAPIDAISQILLTKEKTVAVTRGATVHGMDALPDTGVIQIVSIPGYASPADYARTGNSVDWAAAGAEPAPGASYNVTYRYRASVAPTAFTDTTFTVAGGAAGGDAIVTYTWKLPRIDRLCLRTDGSPVYIKGVSAAANPFPPIIPGDLLSLAEISNDWMTTPAVKNSRVIFVDQELLRRVFAQVEDHSRLLQLERIKSGIDAREPTAHRDMFVDPLVDNSMRDAGEAQTATVGGGMIQLPIAVTPHYATLAAPVLLDHVEEIITAQELVTGCELINPYANYIPLPGSLTLSPASDFWTAVGPTE